MEHSNFTCHSVDDHCFFGLWVKQIFQSLAYGSWMVLIWCPTITITLPSSPVECSSALWLTSIRWELTFLPFLFQLTLGLGSPVAWHTKETTPPETPIWSTGTLVNRGGASERRRQGRTGRKKDISHKTNVAPLEQTHTCLFLLSSSVSYSLSVSHTHTLFCTREEVREMASLSFGETHNK